MLPIDRSDNAEKSSMERYLGEKLRPFFDTVNHESPVNLAFTSSYQPQYSLTWSSQSHTSSGSVALSPPADSDGMYEGTQGPTTPELSAPSPPHDHKVLPVHQWDGQHLQYAQFPPTYIPRSRYINMSDINPEQVFSTPPAEHHDDFMRLDYTNTPYQMADESAIDPNLVPGDMLPETSSVQANDAQQTDTEQLPLPARVVPRSTRESRPRRPRSVRRSTSIRAAAQDRTVRTQSNPLTRPERILPRHQELGHCEMCNEDFKDTAALQRHVRSSHRRAFTCVFHYAGCSSTFGAKNEWKRHVLSQHLGLYYWHCTLDHCSQAKPLHAHGRSPAPGIPNYGSVFNRKDLYTQHVRRMHLGGDTGNKKAQKEAEEKLKVYQEAAKKKRCELPEFMECPATGCSKDFRGANAWDERMEHVACHLGRAASGKEENVLFGGDHDLTLTDWAASPDVGVTVAVAGGGWQHRNPLKGSSSVGAACSPPSEDQDAEGEDCLSEN
ncbi:hypothetical protein CC79DRAFT_1369571 [Sarocladium strictum]